MLQTRIAEPLAWNMRKPFAFNPMPAICPPKHLQTKHAS
jgi:hypothetical protein